MNTNKGRPTLPMGYEPSEREESLWRHDVMTGVFRKKSVHFYCVTTKHIISGSQVLAIDDLIDAVTVNQEHEQVGGFNGVGTRVGNMSVRTNSFKAKGRTIGDIIFTGINGSMIFHDIPDARSIERLVKSLMMARKERRKLEEGK